MSPEPLTQPATYEALRDRCVDRLIALETAPIRVTPDLAAKVLRHCAGILRALDDCVRIPALSSSES